MSTEDTGGLVEPRNGHGGNTGRIDTLAIGQEAILHKYGRIAKLLYWALGVLVTLTLGVVTSTVTIMGYFAKQADVAILAGSVSEQRAKVSGFSILVKDLKEELHYVRGRIDDIAKANRVHPRRHATVDDEEQSP